MLISELIRKLQKAQDDAGDCEIYVEEPAMGSPNYGTPEIKVVMYTEADGSECYYAVVK